MKGIFKRKVLFAVLFSVLIFLTASLEKIVASGQATIPPTHLGFVDKLGYYRVVGEVANVGDKNIRYVRVNATFYSIGNSVIAYRSSYAMLDVLLPGRKAPFEIVLGNKTASALVDHYSLNVSSDEYQGEKPSILQIMQSSTFIDEAGFQKVNGTVKNLATSNATYVKVVATFYNLQGKVVGATYGYTKPSTIMPSHTELFELELGQKADNFSSYSLAAESMEYAAVSPAATTLTVSLSLNTTIVNSGANVSVQVHVDNGTLLVKDAAVQLVSDKGGVFNPQSGYTNSDGNFTATFTAPTVTQQTLISITANATKIGFIVGQSLRQITVNPISTPDLTFWTYFAAGALAIAIIGGGIVITKRKRRRPKKRSRSHFQS